jgi:CheY-like chemotaxis protein
MAEIIPLRRARNATSAAATPALRILVVDDEPAAAATIHMLLRRAGHMPELATSAEAAHERLQCEPFDIVITDVSMPGMGGAELIRRWRRLVPMIAMTGYTEQVLPDMPRLEKPFGASELLDAVRQALEFDPPKNVA